LPKKYYEINKIKIIARIKKQSNRAEKNNYAKNYRKNNTDKINASHEANRENKKLYNKKYRNANKEKIKLLKRRCNKIRYKTDPQVRLNINTSSLIRISLKGNKKGMRWETLVGYSVVALKRHLEKQFTEGMSWKNYGLKGWTIDHKIPISVFNFTKPEHEDFKRCWALSNLQPMWAMKNISKGNKLNIHFQPSLLF